MNVENKEKSIQERLDDLEKWQEDNAEKLQQDFREYEKEYSEALGVYAPNMNEQRYISDMNEVYTTEDYRLDMGIKKLSIDMGGKSNREIYDEEYINDLINDSLLVEQLPDQTLLPTEKQAVNDLKEMLRLIKSIEKYIKKYPNTISGFRDGLNLLKFSYEQGISALNQVRMIPTSDFITNETIRRCNIRNFKDSVQEGMKEIDYLVDYFYDLTEDLIEW